MKILIGVFSLTVVSSLALATIDWKKAVKEIKYLKPSKFTEVPNSVKKVIEAEGCTIPQAFIEEKAHNIIQGSFASQDSKDWAVLCSKNGRSSIFIVWEKESACPTKFASKEDKLYIQGRGRDKPGFSRMLSTVKKIKLDHHEEYVGPIPKNMDHQGIDDAYVEKASGAYYCEDGKWLDLPGSD